MPQTYLVGSSTHLTKIDGLKLVDMLSSTTILADEQSPDRQITALTKHGNDRARSGGSAVGISGTSDKNAPESPSP
jgi:hypothetical protein